MRKHQNNSNNKILLGILAGSIVGTIAAFAATSRRGREFREDLYDAYHGASKKLSSAAHNFTEKTHGLSDRFLNRNNHSSNYTNLSVGAIAGGILGISAIVFLSSNAGKGIRRKILHTVENITDHSFEDIAHSTLDRFGESISPWIKKAERFMDTFHKDESSYGKKASNGTTFDKILDWASVAAHTIQSLKK